MRKKRKPGFESLCILLQVLHYCQYSITLPRSFLFLALPLEWFSTFSLPWNHLEDLLKHRLMGPIPRAPKSVSRACLTNSWVMLLLLSGLGGILWEPWSRALGPWLANGFCGNSRVTWNSVWSGRQSPQPSSLPLSRLPLQYLKWFVLNLSCVSWPAFAVYEYDTFSLLQPRIWA